MTTSLLSIKIRNEQDVIAARLRARQIAEVCGFSTLDQARIATTVSELARTLVGYSAMGEVEFAIAAAGRTQALQVCIAENLLHKVPTLWVDETLHATTAKLMSGYEIITSESAGSKIAFWKNLPENTDFDFERVRTRLLGLAPLPVNVALSEANYQNHELTKALHDLQERQDELTHMAERLEETNSRVEALNALLEEKAVSLMGADRRKDEFLALLSHELRGPLSTINMAAQMLRGVTSLDRVKDFGAMVGRQASHMSRLVEDLLDVSRVTRGLVTIQRLPVDIAGVVREAAEQQHAALEAKRHALTVAIPETDRFVNGDRTRLIQVMGNLLGNAIRYTPDGGAIRIEAVFKDEMVQICVADNGRGIDAEYLPKLFDLYVQEERSSERSTSGLGLGLALVKSLVEVHGGHVHVTSEGRGKGSMFYVDLPLLQTIPSWRLR